MRWDPLAFDEARREVALALAMPAGAQRRARLEAAARRLLAFEVGHELLSRAFAELGAGEELERALALELYLAAEAAPGDRLAAIGSRLLAAYGGDEAGLRGVVRRTSARLRAPATVVRQAVALAGISGGADATLASLAAIDRALAAGCAALPPPDPGGLGLTRALVEALARVPGCELVGGLEAAPRRDVDRVERAVRLARALLAGRSGAGALGSAAGTDDGTSGIEALAERAATPPDAAGATGIEALAERAAALHDAALARSAGALPAALEAATRAGWIRCAIALLSRCDAAAADAARVVRLLPVQAGRLQAPLELLAAVLPGSVLAPGLLLVPGTGGNLAALFCEQGRLVLRQGVGRANELPEPHRAAFEEAAGRGLVTASASARTVIERSGTGMTWRRRDAVPGVDVEVGVARCMGDSSFQITLRSAAGRVVSFLDESPDTIALHRGGAFAWHLRPSSRGAELDLHVLDPAAPAPPSGPPAREEVVLLSETIGADCPRIIGAPEFRFRGAAS